MSDGSLEDLIVNDIRLLKQCTDYSYSFNGGDISPITFLQFNQALQKQIASNDITRIKQHAEKLIQDEQKYNGITLPIRIVIEQETNDTNLYLEIIKDYVFMITILSLKDPVYKDVFIVEDNRTSQQTQSQQLQQMQQDQNFIEFIKETMDSGVLSKTQINYLRGILKKLFM